MKHRLSRFSCVFFVAMVAGWLTCPSSAWGYAVGAALSLEKLAEESDLIFKGTVLSDAPVEDDWFKPLPSFGPRETRFKVISVIKGGSPGDTVRFRHYDFDQGGGGYMYMPLYYHFEDKATCIVFAKKTDAAGVFRQFSEHHTARERQGVLNCASESPVTGKNLKEVIWNELTSMLKDGGAVHPTYAIGQLDEMSLENDDFNSTRDFNRTEVLRAVRSSLKSEFPQVVEAALTLVGSQNPYMREDRAGHWLAAVGSAPSPNLAAMNAQMKNTGGVMCREDLCAIADGKRSEGTRALAIRALGLVREPSLRENLRHWLADPQPAVRAAAAVLLSDFPGTETNGALTMLDADVSADVRSAVARAIAFSQKKELLSILVGLLRDSNEYVRRCACQGLLSFSTKDVKVAHAFEDALAIKEFDPLFLTALARDNPAKYLDGLARVIKDQPQPENWSGGTIPAYAAWKILFEYVTTQPPEAIKSGKLNASLDALEHTGQYSSSEPRDLYAFFLRTGLRERAMAFRAKAVKAVSYDLDYYFKQVDGEPPK